MVFSIERFLAVYFPITSKLIITSTKKKCSVTCLIAATLIIYSLSLFTTGSEMTSTSTQQDDSIRECVPLTDWLNFTKYVTLTDTVATIFIPFVSISFLNLMIAFKLIKRYKHHTGGSKMTSATSFCSTYHGATQRLRLRLPSYRSHINDIDADAESSFEAARGRFLVAPSSSHAVKRKRAYSRATLVLLSISTMFLVLNFPLALDKVLYFLSHKSSYFAVPLLAEMRAGLNFSAAFGNYSMYDDEEYAAFSNALSSVDPREYLLNKLTANVHYLNFVLNFFLYSLNGAKFRQAVLRLFRC